MGSDTTRRFGAKGRSDVLMFDPEDLTIVEKEGEECYDVRHKLPINEKTVLTMMAMGVKVPILIRRNGETKEGKPIVLVEDGRQRVKCAREANRRLIEQGQTPIRIPGIQQQGDAKTSFATMVITNEHRTKDDPMTRARKIAQYLGMGYPERDAATLFNTTEQTIRSSMKLLDCSAKVQAAVEAKQIPMGLAVSKFSVMPRAEQDAELASLVASGAIAKPAAVRQAVEKAAGDRGRVRATGIRVRPRKELERAIALFDGDEAAVAAACASGGAKDALLALLQWTLHDREALRHPVIAMLMVETPKPPKPPKEKAEKKTKKTKAT